MRIPVRRWLPWALLLSLVAGLWIGWTILRDSVQRWAYEEHKVGAWSIRVFGGAIPSWRFASADSARIVGPGARILLAGIRLEWERRDGSDVHRFPLHLRVAVRKGFVALDPVPSSTSAKAPAFPAALRLPVSFAVALDTLRLVRAGGPEIRADGIRLGSRGPSGVVGQWRDLRHSRIPAWSSGAADLDWGRDSLRAGVRLALASGCCARDSLVLSAVAGFRDLTAGRVSARARIDALAGWNELLPGIVRAPSLEDVQLEFDARRRSGGRPEMDARLRFSSGPYRFFPGFLWDVRVEADSAGSVASVDAVGAEGARVAVRLAAPGRIDSAVLMDRFAGTIDVRGIGYTLVGQSHPFDGRVEVASIGAKGGDGVVRLASGSVVEGGATWKGLHWHCKGVIAAGEPWAVDWVPGISLRSGSVVTGRDTVGAALFRAHVLEPRYRWFVGDSMDVSVRLDTRRIQFPSIRLARGGRSWSGLGKVDWSERAYGFSMSPDSGVGFAQVEGDFLGGVRSQVDDFPAQGLPIDHEKAKLPYPVSVSGSFDRIPHAHPDSIRMTIAARLQAQPAADPLELSFDAWQQGRVAEVSDLNLRLGSSGIRGGAGAILDSLGWSPSFLRAEFDDVDLERAASVWPGLPLLRGRIEGTLAAARDEGVSASARVSGLAVQGKQGWSVLPDLVVWGARDTLNVGGRWPVGKELDPFRLTMTGLFERDLAFELLAFHGDVVRLRGKGVLADKKRLHANLTADGGIAIPGTEARLDGLLVDGELRGVRGVDGFAWSASLEGKEGMLKAIRGLPLRSRFLVRAEPEHLFLDSLSLRGERAGDIAFKGAYDIAGRLFTGEGRARDFRLDLGEGKRFRLGAMDLVAGADQRLRASLSDVSLEQTWGRGQGLWVDVDKANLILVQAQDWRKLQGTAQVRKLLFTRDIADLRSLTRSAVGAFGRGENVEKGPRTESVPLLLDIRAWGGGDSIRVDNNLAQASLAFDLQATGPAEALLLNGTVDADPDGSTFGYSGKTFALDELHIEWNVAPPLGGKYVLGGSRSILQACPDASATSTIETATNDSCALKLSSKGTLAEPRMFPLTADCGAGGADEGAVQAALALARDCYPSSASANGTIGGNAKSAAIDLGVQQGMGYVNDAIRNQLERQRREGRVFLPDSLALTDVPIGGTRDQLGLLAFYRLSDETDAEGEYRHTFVRTATATSGATVLADDYSLRLRWRPPMEWIQERRIQERLRNHLVFQVEFGQSLDARSQRETTVSPSIRYRWEFW